MQAATVNATDMPDTPVRKEGATSVMVVKLDSSLTLSIEGLLLGLRLTNEKSPGAYEPHVGQDREWRAPP
jgi:hypothetical protein